MTLIKLDALAAIMPMRGELVEGEGYAAAHDAIFGASKMPLDRALR